MPIQKLKENMTTDKKYAGFWVRFLAEYLEAFLGLLVFSYVVFSLSQSTTLAQVLQGLVSFLVFVALPWGIIRIFLTSFLTSKYGGGVGKLITGLKVENSEHKYLSFKRSLFRYTIGYLFSGVLFGLGFLAVIKDPQKRAFHDKMVGSYVVIRQTLWPLALILLVASLFGNYYFLTQAYSKALTGPLKFEVFQLASDYQQQQKNVEEATKSAIIQPEATSSAKTATATPSPINNTSNVIFVSLKDSATSDQSQPLITKLQQNPNILRVQFLTKEDATKAYQSVAPGKSLPIASLTPVLIIYLVDSGSNTEILNEVKSDPLVQAAYPYSL